MRRFATSFCLTASVLFAGACNPGEVSVPGHTNDPGATATPAASAEPIAKGIPHGGQIVEVAVTDSADAALTFDNLLGVRLWPSLDGTRPPVAVSADAPDTLSLAHSGDRDLLAVILDAAGTVRAIRLGRDGRVHGRVSLPGQYVQALAIDDGVLVRTPDHAIEWFAPDGTSRGRLAPAPGMQVRTLVAHHGHAAALLADATLGTARTLRFLTMTTVLDWDTTVELDSAVRDGSIALSSLGNRIAYVDVTNNVQVCELGLTKRPIAGSSTFVREDAHEIGFYDQDHVAVGGGAGGISMWTATPKQEPTPANDPWAVSSYVSGMLHEPTEMTHLVDGFAVADDVVVTGYGGSLALDDLSRTRYLGWQAIGSGLLSRAGNAQVMTLTGSRFVWLDDKLASIRDLELRPNNSGPWIYAVPLDEHHVVTQAAANGHYQVELVDLDTKVHVGITNGDIDRMEYAPESQLLSITLRHSIQRFQLDLATNSVQRLDPIHIKGSALSVHAFDPAHADGVTAAVIGWDSDSANSQTLTLYRAKGAPTHIHPFDGLLLDARGDGTLFVLYRTGKMPELREMKGKDVVRKVPLPTVLTAALSPDASRISYVADDAVVMLDATGTELWRQSLWSAAQVMFSVDGSKLFVRASGGVAVLDAATGIRTALECGWNFGLTEEPNGTNPIGIPSVCEDPMLQ